MISYTIPILTIGLIRNPSNLSIGIFVLSVGLFVYFVFRYIKEYNSIEKESNKNE
jgi:hypothetical protein